MRIRDDETVYEKKIVLDHEEYKNMNSILKY